MKKITILCGRYLPGYKDGGPVRTIINLVKCLGKEYHFKIVTNDRDHGDTEAYPNIKYDQPNVVGDAEVWYIKPQGFKVKKILEMTRDADLIYICGPYDDYAYRTLFLKCIGKIQQRVIVAAMGSFSEGAFRIKKSKKQLYITFCKFCGLFKNITWSVTSQLEERDVKRVFGTRAKCIIAEDLPREVPSVTINKKEGPLNIIFVSRICEKKNLLYAIDTLTKARGTVVFHIYGTLEDMDYWNRCQNRLHKLPSNIKWEYMGVANSEKIVDVFSKYDIFLFPTKGENYGHVIFEALAGGCIPIISDCTPWNDLEENGCGKVIPLEDKEAFTQAVEMYAQMSPNELGRISLAGNMYARQKYEYSIVNTGYRAIFE